MRNWKKIIRGGVWAFALALAGCGGSGGSSTPTAATETATATGQFIDAPVAGLTYESGSQKGQTDATGKFKYEVGKTVKFSVGGIVIGEAPAQVIMTPVNLAAAGSDSSTAEVVARVQFLMSISSIDPSTGTMTIPDNVRTAASGRTIDFATATQAQLASLISALDSTKTLVTQSDAQNHLQSNIYSLFQGDYSGSWTSTSGNSSQNGSSGTWSVIIDANGGVTGTDSSGSTISGSMTTKLSSDTKYAFSGTTNAGSAWTGTLDVVTKVFSGTWSNSASGSAGTFTNSGGTAVSEGNGNTGGGIGSTSDITAPTNDPTAYSQFISAAANGLTTTGGATVTISALPTNGQYLITTAGFENHWWLTDAGYVYADLVSGIMTNGIIQSNGNSATSRALAVTKSGSQYTVSMVFQQPTTILTDEVAVGAQGGGITTATTLESVTSYYQYANGGILGIVQGKGVQFGADGTARFYNITADANGFITSSSYLANEDAPWSYVGSGSIRTIRIELDAGNRSMLGVPATEIVIGISPTTGTVYRGFTYPTNGYITGTLQ
jgi:hypothetical protein